MPNKRLLIKNLLSHNDENTFFDKKESIDLSSIEGKGKFLKHICALSNSNPENNSYLIIGVTNVINTIIGFEFVDDSKIQNLVKANFSNPPLVKYENIYFPNLPKEKVIGLLTISPKNSQTSFKKAIGKIPSETAYYRQGSNSIPIEGEFSIDKTNKKTVAEIENFSKISLKQLLDDIFEFYTTWSKEYLPQYIVFKDQFIVCWAGYRTNFGKDSILSEVDIRIINEGSRLFYSAVQWVNVLITESEFCITEYINLGYDDNFQLYPLEKTCLSFDDNGKYSLLREVVFIPPKFNKEEINKLYDRAKEAETSFINGRPMNSSENYTFCEGLANYFLICYFNGIREAKNDLIKSAEYLDGSAAEWQSECMRILEKVESKNGN
jgi:hypothetical protein